MIMRPMPPVRAALLVLLLLCGPAALAGEDAPYPVWWSPELGLESLDDIEWKLEESFPRTRWYEVVTHDVQLIYTDELIDKDDPERGYFQGLEDINIERRTINDCLSLITWRDQGFGVFDGSPFSYHASRLDSFYSGYCYTLSALKDAKPSKKSFLRDFAFDEDAIDYIPPMIRLGWRCRGLNEFLRANRDGVPWRDFRHGYYTKGLPNVRLTVIDQKSISFDLIFEISSWYPDYIAETVRIIITGQADFNGDGWDDLLIRREYGKRLEGEIVPLSSALYVVTRKETDSVLRVVDYIGPPPLNTVGRCSARDSIIDSGQGP